MKAEELVAELVTGYDTTFERDLDYPHPLQTAILRHFRAVRREALEEAAKIADAQANPWDAAQAIRELIASESAPSPRPQR